MEAIQLSVREARRFLLRYHHLTPDTGLNKSGLVDFIRCVSVRDATGLFPEAPF